jgi:branched-chain amino acid transport system substrate-binding protein
MTAATERRQPVGRSIGPRSAAGALALACLSLLAVAAAAQPREVVIGVLYPLSGPTAQAGVDARAAAELAAEIVNGKHDLDLPLAGTEGLPNLGGAKVRLVVVDHQGKPELGQTEAERLITQEKAVALYGAYHSSVSATASQVAERHGLPYLSGESSSPTLHRRGLKWFFRTSPHDEHFSIAMFDFLREFQARKGVKITTVGIVHEDTLFGADSAKVQEQLAGQHGYQVPVKLAYRARATSLTAEVQRLKAANPGVLLPTSYTSDAILLVRTARELDYNPPMVLAQDAGFVESDFLAAVGKDAEGIMSRSVFSLDLAQKRPVVGKVNELYRKKHGKDLNDNTSRAFMGLLVLADAINRAGSTDPEALRKALLATDLKPEQTIMPWKGVRFDPATGQNELGTPLITQWRGGALRVVWPFELATTDVLYPLTKWGERR